QDEFHLHDAVVRFTAESGLRLDGVGAGVSHAERFRIAEGTDEAALAHGIHVLKNTAGLHFRFALREAKCGGGVALHERLKVKVGGAARVLVGGADLKHLREDKERTEEERDGKQREGSLEDDAPVFLQL